MTARDNLSHHGFTPITPPAFAEILPDLEKQVAETDDLHLFEIKFKKSARARKIITWERWAHGEAAAKSKLIQVCLTEFGKRPVILSCEDKGGLFG